MGLVVCHMDWEWLRLSSSLDISHFLDPLRYFNWIWYITLFTSLKFRFLNSSSAHQNLGHGKLILRASESRPLKDLLNACSIILLLYFLFYFFKVGWVIGNFLGWHPQIKFPILWQCSNRFMFACSLKTSYSIWRIDFFTVKASFCQCISGFISSIMNLTIQLQLLLNMHIRLSTLLQIISHQLLAHYCLEAKCICSQHSFGDL